MLCSGLRKVCTRSGTTKFVTGIESSRSIKTQASPTANLIVTPAKLPVLPCIITRPRKTGWISSDMLGITAMHGGICRQYRCNIYFFPVEEGRGAVAPTTTNVRRLRGTPLWFLLCLELDIVATMIIHARKDFDDQTHRGLRDLLGRECDDSFSRYRY